MGHDGEYVDIDALDAKGGPFHVRAMLRLHQMHEKGAILIDTSLKAVGLELNDDGITIRPFGAEQWFDKAVAGN